MTPFPKLARSVLYLFARGDKEMVTISVIGMLAIACVLLTVVLLKINGVSRSVGKAVDLSPVLSDTSRLVTFQEQTDRMVRDEFSRSRQEDLLQSQALRSEVVASLSGMGSSVTAKLEGLTGSNDQKLELLRSGLESRLESFNSEFSRKGETLTDSVRNSATSLRDEVSTHLAQFRCFTEERVTEAHTSQTQQTETISKALSTFQSAVDDNQLRLQNAVETRFAALTQQTGGSLSKVEESSRAQAHDLRAETGESFKNLSESMMSTLKQISEMQRDELQGIRSTVNNRLESIQVQNEKKLEQMRQTVDEKLQGTLEARLGASFKQVSERLEQVYMGLGEMKTLATGVGDLKRALTNVKVRGTWGESQLGAIIEEILTPDQFGKNVATSGTGERVDYAVKLPGSDSNGESIWLPIDAKFPLEDYDRLVQASERADLEQIDKAAKQLEVTLKNCAKSIREKYLAPPLTTDFGILFLSTEGLYAEVMRRPGLADSIQREHRVILAGPSTLAALLNALQMGFRTLAIQKRSSEVWELLGAVKTEFGKYADVLAKVKRKLNEAQTTIDKAETRTRAIHRKLRTVDGPDVPELVAEGDETEASSILADGQEEILVS
jgi:DNA recombination protein RmuC